MNEPRWTDVELLKTGYLDHRSETDDDHLKALLASCEDMFERGSNRLFSPDPVPNDTTPPDPVVRRVSSGGKDPEIGADDPYEIFLPDARELVRLVIVGQEVPESESLEAWPLDGWQLLPSRPGEPATTALVPSKYVSTRSESWDVIAVGHFGFVDVPADVVDAVYLMAARSFADRQATYADQILTAEGDNLAYFRSMPQRAWRIFQSYWMPGR